MGLALDVTAKAQVGQVQQRIRVEHGPAHIFVYDNGGGRVASLM